MSTKSRMIKTCALVAVGFWFAAGSAALADGMPAGKVHKVQKPVAHGMLSCGDKRALYPHCTPTGYPEVVPSSGVKMPVYIFERNLFSFPGDGKGLGDTYHYYYLTERPAEMPR